MSSSFDSIPILDLARADDPATKPDFLLDLRHALLEVGFLYIKNTGVPDDLVRAVVEQARAFFDLPDDKKLEVEMKNAASFLGYNRLGNEITRFKADWREQIDLSTSHPLPSPDDPLYHNLLAPNQWPDAAALPRFRPVYEEYMRLMAGVSMRFTALAAEAIGLPSDAFDRFFDADQQHKLKIVKYPDVQALGQQQQQQQQQPNGEGTQEQEQTAQSQGVGPHKDSMLSSYLLQASPHRGLQVQNHEGAWIDCPPIDGTFVVAIGQGLEAITQGVCKSTTHRVLSPAPGSGPRFSVPFFQGVSYDATFESMDVPAHVQALRAEANQRHGVRVDDIEFTFSKGRWGHLGEATLMNRIKSHPDVGERWYPDLLRKIRDEQAEEKARINGANNVAEEPQSSMDAAESQQGRAVHAH